MVAPVVAAAGGAALRGGAAVVGRGAAAGAGRAAAGTAGGAARSGGTLGQARGMFNQMSPQHQKAVQKKLSALQKNAPKLAKNIAKDISKGSPVKAAARLVMNLLKQVDLTKDWMFIPVLTSFALLKDIFDIAFAAVPGVGIIISFIAELMLICLAVIVLLITGSDMKNRGLAKYFIGLAVSFASEAFPGIGWMPLAFIESLLLYLFVLFDRATQEPAKAEQEAQ
jgi:hypothetical protein